MKVANIGGGVIGASIAWHLTRAGVRDVVILDRAPGPGAGSTGRATGGYRAQFATPVNIRLSLKAREKLLRFEDETGVDPCYEQVGYLWLAFNDRQLDAVRRGLEVQHREGLSEAREVDEDDVAAINPFIEADGMTGAAFCPTDGYIRPLEILRGYLESAQRGGVEVKWNSDVIGLELDENDTVKAVQLAQEHVDVDAVVDAAGPWASPIAAMAGIDLPVMPLRRQAAFTEPTDLIPPTMPMSIFMNDGFHVRARDGRAMICWPNPEAFGEPASLDADDSWIATVTEMARRRVPALRDLKIDRAQCYAGLYEMSPDDHAILGAHPDCPNMFFANGSSGHGVMHSPAIGEIIADMITGRRPEIDVSILRPSRFEEGKAIEALELL
jgi:sarcosine oxidase subunit beta